MVEEEDFSLNEQVEFSNDREDEYDDLIKECVERYF